MKYKPLLLSFLLILLQAILASNRFEKREMTDMSRYKGNLHTHAREGASDTSIENVVRWYLDHDYHFLVITDHSIITRPAAFSIPKDSSFLFIPGEEIIGYGDKAELEINGFNLCKAILPIQGKTTSGALQDCIDAVRLVNCCTVQKAIRRFMIYRQRATTYVPRSRTVKVAVPGFSRFL